MCVATAALFGWLLLEFLTRSFAELNLPYRPSKRLGDLLGVAPAPARGITHPRHASDGESAPTLVMTPAPPPAITPPRSVAPVPAPSVERRRDAPSGVGAGLVQPGSGRRNLAMASRIRRRDDGFEEPRVDRAPEDPAVQEGVTVISRTPRRQTAPATWAPSPARPVPTPWPASAEPAARPVPTPWPASAEPAAPSDVPPWTASAEPAAPSDVPPWTASAEPAAPTPMPWPPRREASAPARAPDWRHGPMGADPEARRDLGVGSAARRTAMMVGSRAREAILGYPFPAYEPAESAPYAGEEPAPGQTVVLVGDDVEAWVRERLYGGRLPDR